MKSSTRQHAPTHFFSLHRLICGWGMLVSPVLAAPPAGSDPLPKDALRRIGDVRLQHGAEVVSVDTCATQDLIVTAGRDHWVQLWRLSTGKRLARVRQSWVAAVALASDGKSLASSDQFGTIRLWSIKDGTLRRLCEKNAHRSPICALAYSAEGKRFISLGEGQRVVAWKCEGRRLTEQSSWTLGNSSARTVALAPDGNIVAIGDAEGSLSLWSIDAAKEQRRWRAHPGTINAVRFSRDGEVVTSFGGDGKLCRWKCATGKEISHVQSTVEGRNVASICEAGKALAIADTAHRVALWDLEKRERTCVNEAPLSPCVSLSASRNGSVLVHLDHLARVAVCGGMTGKVIRREPSGPRAPMCIAVSPDGKTLARGTSSFGILICDSKTGKELAALANPPAGQPLAMTFSSDGKMLAVSYAKVNLRYYLIRLWSMTTGSEIRTFRVPALVANLAFARNNAVLFSSAEDRTVCAWSVATGEQLDRWRGVHDGRGVLAVSHDGKRIATGNQEGVITLTDTATSKARHWSGHVGRVSSLAFSADGHVLLSSGAFEGHVLAWEVSTGRIFRRFEGHLGGVVAVALSADGSRAFSAGADASVLAWDVTGLETKRVARIGDDTSQGKKHWQCLTAADVASAYDAVWALADAPSTSMPLIHNAMKPWISNDARRIKQLILDLDDNDFDVRQNASRKLAKILDLAEPALRRTLAKPPSLEVKMRTVHLLARVRARDDVERDVLQLRRAAVVLEKIGNREATALLEQLAEQSLLPEIQEEATAALRRMKR